MTELDECIATLKQVRRLLNEEQRLEDSLVLYVIEILGCIDEGEI